jgi:GNAT superfamily N-acetyltransferase
MMDDLEIRMFPVDEATLVKYHQVPSSLEVRTKFEVEVLDSAFGGMTLREKPVETPYVKNYEDNPNPISWYQDFHTNNWVLFLATQGKLIAGGLTIACQTPELRILNGRDDLACVWDLRVRPEYKHQGIGSVLFKNAVAWSKNNGFKQLCVETQNVNVPACRFYLKQGCTLGGINRYAYYGEPALAGEVQLIWYLDL